MEKRGRNRSTIICAFSILLREIKSSYIIFLTINLAILMTKQCIVIVGYVKTAIFNKQLQNIYVFTFKHKSGFESLSGFNIDT